MNAKYIIGDTTQVMATMPDNSVDLILTSPPFLALRTYLPDGHPNKHLEIGTEQTPADFIDKLLELTAEWSRLLTPHGTLCLELGDTYSGSGGSGGDYREGHLRSGQASWSGSAKNAANAKDVEHATKDKWASSDSRPGWPLAKSATLIPELYRTALAYGINPLTGAASPAGQWRIRNTITWCRPNPPVGALGDKFRPATSDMVVACKSKTRWFDLDAVRTEPDPANTRPSVHTRKGISGRSDQITGPIGDDGRRITSNPAGAPPLDWWSITTSGYAGSHYATWPPELLTRPIQAMCPIEVCRDCGEPRRRIVQAARTPGGGKDNHAEIRNDQSGNAGGYTTDRSKFGHGGSTERTTTGWTDCGHNNYRPGIVLDPFAGTGTTLMVATGHGRDAIGIDLDERNADLARERCGMFIDIETHQSAAAA